MCTPYGRLLTKTGPDWRGRVEVGSVDKIAASGECRASYWTPIPEDLGETDTLGRLLLVAFACQHLHTYTCPGTPHCLTSPSARLPTSLPSFACPRKKWEMGAKQRPGLTSYCIREKMFFINKPKRNLSFQSSSYCASNKLVTFSEKPQPVVRWL